VVLIAGEAGIGKSRLSVALLERLAIEPHTRLRYFCSPQHTDSALYPIIGQMERAAELTRDDTPRAKLDKLDGVLAQTSTSIQDAALFAEMLSLPNDGRYPALELAPQHRRQRTLEALISQLEALARQNPVLMIFEDAQWTDPTSLEALGRVVDRIRMRRVLLIVTFRPDFDPPWIGQPHVTTLTINRLAQREVEALIDRVVGNNPLAANIRQDIVERADGIPLFVEEITKAVLEAETEGEARRAVAAVPSPALTVPASLYASLMARLDRLGPAKEVAQVGAAIGREFSHPLLASVVPKSDAELGSALERLIQAGLLFRQGMPPHATYLFKHALVQDAAYGTLLRAARHHLHGRIAVVLEGQFPELVHAQPELLARHLTEASLSEKAIDYWLKGGQLAGARSAHAEAVSHLTRGLTLLRELPSSIDRDRRELQLQCVLAPALNATKGYSATETVNAYERSRELIATTGEIEPRDAVLNGLSAAYYSRGEFENALTVARECLRAAEAGGGTETAILCIGHRQVAGFHNATGDFRAALEHAQRALALFDPERHSPLAWRYAHDIGVGAMGQTALALTDTGFPTQGAALAAEALARAVRLNHPNSIGYALFYGETLTALKRRDLRAVGERATKLETHGREQRLPHWVAWGMCLQGPALAASGRAETAVERIEAGIAACERMQNRAFRPTFHAALAEALDALGRPSEALRAVADGIDAAARTGERWMVPELYRIQGGLLLSSHDTGSRDAAEGCFRRSLEGAKQQGSRLQELRTTASLARLWRDQGKLTQARDLLAPIYGWFTEGFDTPVLQDAKALLDELA
jgi:predicted ATPase